MDVVTREEVVARCAEWLRGDRLRHVITANPELLVGARDPAVRETFQRADLVVPDGAGIAWASVRVGVPVPERVPGVELVEALAALAAREGKSVALLGGRGGAAAAVARRLAARHHGARFAVAGDNAPPDSPALLEEIHQLRPALLFVAFGSPTQERWIAGNRDRLEQSGVRIAVGVGGAFDILGGRLPRAPRWMRVVGFEWLWRLLLQPWRLPRVFRAVVSFPMKVLLHRKRHEAIERRQ